MTEDAAPATDAGEARYGPLRRSLVRRYGAAVMLALAALVAARLIVPYADAPVYSLLVGAVAVSVWYGGLGSGLVTLAIAWVVGPFLLVAPGAPTGFHSHDDLLRWLVPLVVALLVVWIYFLMRRLQQRAVTRAVVAEESSRQMESLQELATALSAALTQTDVASALLGRLPTLIGASAGSVGLVDGPEIVIVNPPGISAQTHQPGLRLPLDTRAPIVRAAAENDVVVVRSREEFADRFPEGAALSPEARAALAVPLRVAGEVVGSMSFLYAEDTDIDDAMVAVATIASDLGGQALERALLYDRERESRRALDRILRVAPRFHLDTAKDAGVAICREARMTFGSDYAELWGIADDGVQLVATNPPERSAGWPDAPLDLTELPSLERAVRELEVTFVAEVERVPNEPMREHLRGLGVRSWLWAPIVIGGQAERALLIAWHAVVSEPDSSTVLLARRFADQAGLALEQIQRREAEAQAARRAERAQRLQRVTAALSQAVTPAIVSDTCLEHAMDALGADAGLIGFVDGSSNQVELVSWQGYTDGALEPYKRLPLDSPLPLSLSISSGEPVWAVSGEEHERFASGERLPFTSDDTAWVAVPLESGDLRGAFQLSFRSPPEVSDEDREWLVGLGSQCAQAFERSRLFDQEQRLRRRSERLQSMTASLSSSVTQVDAANVTVSEVVAAIDASSGALAVVAEEQRQLVRLARTGYESDDTTLWLDVPLDVRSPATRAISRRSSRLYETRDELTHEFPEAAEGFRRTGHESFLFVPLVVSGHATGVVVVSWEQRTSLSDEDRGFVESLVGQAAQALERARRFESERTIAETLQRSVLPVSLPRVDGVQVAARYLPGTAEVDVGGDWFDAITLPNGRLGLVVGDVVGKGVRSAATMAQLRNALRAFALDRTKPASTLARLNRLADGLPESAFATVVYVVVDPETRVCRFSSAGHPPPLAIYPGGTAEYLEGGRGLPLGTAADASYVQDVVEVPVGTTLVLYSDGLIERRGKSIDDGLEELRAAALAGPIDPERLAERVLDELVGAGERRDDIVLLAVRLLVAAPQTLDLRLPSEPGSLDVVREALRVWLERAPVTQAQAGEIVLAAWEACANAVEHAVAPLEHSFAFTAELDDGVVRVAVRDTGSWSPERVRGNRGLGLQLMRSLMSTVDIETGESGTKVALEKEVASPVALAAATNSA